MPKWEDNIFGKVAKEDWIDVGVQVPTRQSDPVDGLFGDLKTDNIIATWESMASEYSIPMMAQFHGFDAEAQTTFRVPIDTHNIEKGLIKVKINQSERLRELTKRGVVGDERLYEYVLDDGLHLADQVITRTKVAKNELLATGQVTIKENNLNLTVDYGVPANHKGLSIDVGAGATVDVLTAIQNIVELALASGVTIGGMVTSRAVLNKLRRNPLLQTAIYGSIGAGSLIRQSDLEGFFNEEFGIGRIVPNDYTYGASATGVETGRPVITQKRYYPDNQITFFAANQGGNLGTGLWGDPPEVDAARFYDVNGSGISPYVYIMQWMETDPAVLWTKASALFMPVLYDPNSLYIANITETPGA